MEITKLYRYLYNKEDVFEVAKRKVPKRLDEALSEATSWLPMPSVPLGGMFTRYLTAEGKRMYDDKVFNLHNPHMKGMVCEVSDLAHVGDIVYGNPYQVVAKATRTSGSLP